MILFVMYFSLSYFFYISLNTFVSTLFLIIYHSIFLSFLFCFPYYTLCFFFLSLLKTKQPRYLIQLLIASLHLRKQQYLNCSPVTFFLALIIFVILLNKKVHSTGWIIQSSKFRKYLILFSQTHFGAYFIDQKWNLCPISLSGCC